MPGTCSDVTRTIDVRRIGKAFERKNPANGHSCIAADLKAKGRNCSRDRVEQCVLGAVTTPFADHCRAGNNPQASGERRRYGTCAVVGSGGSLLGTGCGGEINRHDMIIRINEPVLDGFEADVGCPLHAFKYTHVVGSLRPRSLQVPLRMRISAYARLIADVACPLVQESDRHHDDQWHDEQGASCGEGERHAHAHGP